MAKFCELCCDFSPARGGWLFTVSRPPGLSDLCSNFEFRVMCFLSCSRLMVRAYSIKTASGPVEPLPNFLSWRFGLQILHSSMKSAVCIAGKGLVEAFGPSFKDPTWTSYDTGGCGLISID